MGKGVGKEGGGERVLFLIRKCPSLLLLFSLDKTNHEKGLLLNQCSFSITPSTIASSRFDLPLIKDDRGKDEIKEDLLRKLCTDVEYSRKQKTQNHARGHSNGAFWHIRHQAEQEAKSEVGILC